MSLAILIITAVFLLLGIVQLFLNFNISLLVTVILTVVVAVLYYFADKQAKVCESAENKEIIEACEPENTEACIEECKTNEQCEPTENS